MGDHPALDFLNTIATPVDTPVEWLENGDDLLDWLEGTRLISAADAARCRRKLSKAALDDVASEAKAFREWLRQFVARHAGKPLPVLSESALLPLNSLLSEGQSHWQVTAQANSSPQMRTQRSWSEAQQLLQPLAEATATLICRADFRLVRACEGGRCTLFFLDNTKSHKRRWCSMAVCGNRAKAAAHRKRQRS